MSQQPSSDAAPCRPRSNNPSLALPPEIMDILYPSLKVGAAAGGVGLFVGAVGGIMRNTTPVLFSLFSGFQWFTLGSSYTASKKIVTTAWGGEENMTSSDMVKASTIAGGSAGLVGGLIRGPKNLVPGAIVFSLLGAGGQYAYNAYARTAESRAEQRKNKKSWLDSKWSPLTPLTDKQYESLLEEKILRIDAEIAIIDDNIAAIKAAEGKKQENKEPSTGAPPKSKA